MLWRLGRMLRRKTTLAGLAGGILAFLCIGFIWSAWLLPALDGARTGAEGLGLLVALSDVAPLEVAIANGAEGARLHRQLLAALPADMPWGQHVFWVEALSLGILSLGLLSFFALLPRLHGAGVLLALSALLLFPFSGLNALLPQTGAAIGAGLFLLSAILAPHMRVLRLYLASALILLVHPAAWGFAIVALLLIVQRWVDGRIGGRRMMAEIGLIGAGTLGLAAFLERASLAVAPIFARPEIDLTVLAALLSDLPVWVLSLRPWDAVLIVLTLYGLLQILRHGERVRGFRSVVVMVLLVIPLVAAFTVAGRPGQAVFAMLLAVPLLAIPALGVAEGIPRGDARRGRLLALALGFGAFAFVQAAVQNRDAIWPDLAASDMVAALDAVGRDAPLAFAEPDVLEPAARLAGWTGRYDPEAEVLMMQVPKVLHTTSGLSRSLVAPQGPGFDLAEGGVLRLTVPADGPRVWVRWEGGADLVVGHGPRPCEIVPLSDGWVGVELAGCADTNTLAALDLSGEGAVTGVSLDDVPEGFSWPWGRSDVRFAYASGGGWQRAPVRRNGDFGWAMLGVKADDAAPRALSDHPGLIVLQR